MSNKKENVKKSNPPQIYSEAFKRQVVKELESGLNTIAGLKRKYGIAGNSCLPRWCKQFGKLTYKDQNVIGRPMKDPTQQKIKELEEQLRQKELELDAYRKFINIAEKELHIKIVKKVWHQAVKEIASEGKLTVPELCRLFGFSKQSFYKRSIQSNSTSDVVALKKIVMGVRATLPKTGGRKLHSMLSSQIKSQGMKIGRDKLFDFLREEHLLIKTRRKYHKTTNSKHWMRKYPNLIKDIEICMPEQVWVADITYLMMKKKHYYLHLITDAYSKKIVGYQLADNLQAETTLNALRQAILNRIYDHKLIHHSDRGLQYCSSQYTALLSENGISISMTENSDPYENAVAERVNGILKNEFMLDINFESYFRMKKQVQQSINAYNHLRLHTSIGMLTPNKAHLQNKIKLKTWKKKNPLHVNEKGSLSLV